MVLDDTLKRILTTIQGEVQVKFKEELSIEQIHSVVNTQVEATKLGFSKGITVHWVRFCKFVYTAKNKRSKEVASYLDLLDNQGELTPQEILEAKRLFIIENSFKRKKIIAEDIASRGNKGKTVEEITKLPTNTNTPIMFKALHYKHLKK